jgi:flagellar biosynthesis/type III secretory pathway chaperone
MIDTVLARGKLRQLLSVMDSERAVLLDGPLDDLAKISAKRDQLLDSLVNGGPVSQRILGAKLADIKAMAKRNGALLKAAMEGMKDARKEIENMEESLNEMDTYTPDGAKMVVAQTPPGKGHRV